MKAGLGEQAILRIAHSIKACDASFKVSRFRSMCLDGLEELELKQRVDHIIVSLGKHLPQDFVKTSKILLKLPKHWDFGDPKDSMSGFAAWPVIDFVAAKGLEHPELGLKCLENLTALFSAEFAIRPFILAHPELCHSTFLEWCGHGDHHVRRLVSEGTRPRLPWGKQLKPFIEDPKTNIVLLEALRLDESPYVRKSVANHLNDIGKDHPELLLEICKVWKNEDGGKSDKLIKHALRSLVKAGHPDSFPLLGFTKKPKLVLKHFKLSHSSLKLGERMGLELELEAMKPSEKFVLDYAIHFVKANGKTSPKVFKWKDVEVSHELPHVLNLNKQHHIKAITTRAYYPGEHHIAIHINGVEWARESFELRL